MTNIFYIDTIYDMIDYSFTKFDGIAPRGDDRIAINKTGLIRLSSGFCRKTKARSYKYAVLYFDKTKYAIGIKFSNNKESGVLTVTHDKSAATISAKSFLKVNGLSLRSYYRRYSWEKKTISAIGEIFIIDLKQK